MRVASHDTQRCRIDQVNVPAHQFSEGRLGSFPRVKQEQFTVSTHLRPYISTRRKPNPTNGLLLKPDGLRVRAVHCSVPGFEAQPFAIPELRLQFQRPLAERRRVRKVNALAKHAFAVPGDYFRKTHREGPLQCYFKRTSRAVSDPHAFAALLSVQRKFANENLPCRDKELPPLQRIKNR